jgi:small subunit ribosomal protein S21
MDAIGVKVRNNNVEKALQILNRRVKRSKRMLRYKEKQYYTKPSKERRDAKNAAIRRHEAEQKWNKKYYGH